MAQFLYFLPDLRKDTLDSIPLRNSVLRECGLFDVLRDAPCEEITKCDLHGLGPGDKSGCIICAQTHKGDIPGRIGYYPQEQTWTAIGDGSKLWIGINPASPPKPEDIRRKRIRPGFEVQMSDGETWQVPVIRRPDGGTNLPTHYAWDMSGKRIEPVKPEYVQLWEDWKVVADALSTDQTISDDDAIEFAIKALAINYRFGRFEQSIIGALSRDNVATVLCASVDTPSWHRG